MENIKVDIIDRDDYVEIWKWYKEWVDLMRSEMEDEVTIPKERLEKLKEFDWYMSIQGKLLNK